jgi:hypothetical protein
MFSVFDILVNNAGKSNLWSWAYGYPSASGWVILTLLVIIVIILSILVPIYSRDQHDDTTIFTLGLSVIMMVIMTVPIDVFVVSHIEYPGLEILSISILYYTSFISLLVIIFVIAPFAYSYYKPDLSSRSKSHFFDAFCFLFLALIVIVTVITFSLIISKDKDMYGYQVVGMMMNCVAILSLAPWYFFTAFGMSLFPIGMICHHRKRTDRPEVNSTMEKLREMNSKFDLVGKKMGRNEKDEYSRLEKELKMKEIEIHHFDQETPITEWLIFKIFSVIIGLIYWLISWFILLSIFLGQLERTIFSECGFSCGFRPTKVATIWNPLDLVLTYTSILFPIDVFVYIVVVGVILIATFTGLSMLSSGMFHKLRWRSTVPQGLISSIFVIVAVFYIFFYSFPSFAPQYAKFGSQVFNTTGGDWKLCTIEETTPQCIPTRLAVLTDFAQSDPFVRLVFYFANWFFLAFYFVGLVYSTLNGEYLSFVSEHYIVMEDKSPQQDMLREQFDELLNKSY